MSRWKHLRGSEWRKTDLNYYSGSWLCSYCNVNALYSWEKTTTIQQWYIWTFVYGEQHLQKKKHHEVNAITLMRCLCTVFVVHFLLRKLIGVFTINGSGLSSWKHGISTFGFSLCSLCFVVKSQRLFKAPQLKTVSCFNDSCDFNQECGIPSRSWRSRGLTAHINLSLS